MGALTLLAQSSYNDSIYYKACALYEKGSFKEAIPLFEEVVKLDQEENPEDLELLGISKQWLASCHYKINDINKAQEIDPLYYEFPPFDRRMTKESRRYIHLAEIATSVEMAILWTEKCLEEEKKNLGENHYFVYGSYCNLARLALYSGKEDKCREYISMAKEIRSQYDVTCPFWGSIVEGIEVELESAMGNIDESFHLASRLWDLILGNMDILPQQYFTALSVLNNVYLMRHELELSERITGLAFEEYMSLESDKKPECYLIARGIADYYLISGKPDEGLRLCEEAMRYVESKSEQQAELLFYKGQFHKLGKDFDLALSEITETIELYKNLYPGQSPYLAPYYYSMAEVYDLKRDFKLAEESLKTALKYFRKQGNAEGEAKTIHLLAAIATRTYDFKTASNYLGECLKIMESKNVGTLADLAYIYKERSSVETGEQDITSAIEDLKKAREIYQTNELPLSDDTYIEASLNLCSILRTDEKNQPEFEKIMSQLDSIASEDVLFNKRIKVHLLQYKANYKASLGLYDESVALINESIELAESFDYLDLEGLINDKINFLSFSQRFQEAEELLKSNQEKVKKKFGEVSKEYLMSLVMWGVYMEQNGLMTNYTDYKKISDKILEISGQVYSDNDPEYISSQIVAGSLISLYYPEEAYKILQKNSKKIDKTYGVPYITLYRMLSDMERNRGNYGKALEYTESMLSGIDESAPYRLEIYGLAYNTAGNVFMANSQLAKAEEAYKKALDYVQNSNNGVNMISVTINQSLADLYKMMGRYATAMQYAAQAAEISASGFSHNQMMTFLSLYNGLWGKYQAGLKSECWEDINKIEEIEASMKDLPNLDSSLADRLRAQYFLAERDLERAQNYARLALEERENVENLNLNSQIAFEIGEFDQALTWAKESLKLIEYYIGKKSFESINVNKIIGDIYLSQGKATEAFKQYGKVFDTSAGYIYDNLLTLTKEQRADFWASNYDFYRTYLPFLCRDKVTGGEMNGLLYDAMLFTNGLLLNVDKAILRTIQNSDENIKNLYAKFNGEKEILMQQTQQGIDTNELEKELNDTEKELMKKLREGKGLDRNWSRITWKDVRKSLPKNGVAVEFIDFPIDSIYNVGMALVLTKEMKQPELVELYTREREDFLQNDEMYITETLGDMLWGKLSSELGNYSEIYFVPQGPLCSIAIESLPFSKENLPGELKFHRLTTTAELVYNKNRIKHEKREATLYGGLNYDTSVEELKTDAQSYPELRHRGVLASNLISVDKLRKGEIALEFLEGSKTEIDSIGGIFTKRYGTNPLSKSWNEGTEASFKALSGKYGDVLHISTHGFFNGMLENMPASEKLTIEDIALQNSGLLMAGAANKYIKGIEIPEDLDDGILTGSEISELDFSNVELAVLSACESGIGQVTGEGVFGLQRGFKKAGAKSLLMSLWKVDDDATCYLMTEFYRNWLGDPKEGREGMSKYQALEYAKRSVRNTPGWEEPFYWAAFILLDSFD